MKLYTKATRLGEDSYVRYEGMDQDTVTNLLTALGATDIQFLTEDEWNAANPPLAR